MGAVLILSGPLGLAVGGSVLSSAGPHPVLVGFAAVQMVAMATASVAALRVRAGREAEPALERAA